MSIKAQIHRATKPRRARHSATPGARVHVPRDQGGRCVSLAAEFEVVPGCRVMIDRRLPERRRIEGAWAAEERRGGGRRSGQLESSQGLVVLVR